MELIKFWESNAALLQAWEEDYGTNGRDYILGIEDIQELEELLKDYK